MKALIAIALSGTAAAAFDLAAAKLLSGRPVQAVLQFVASGALGEAAFQGGLTTGLVGLFLHFLIAMIWATIYFGFSLTLPILLKRPLIVGTIYGAVVQAAMSFVVMPLSFAPKAPFSPAGWLIQLVIHVSFVGIPIAFIQDKVLKAVPNRREIPSDGNKTSPKIRSLSTPTDLRPDSLYLALTHRFPLRPLRIEDDYAAAVALMNELLDSKRSPGEDDYLAVLSDLVGDYEDAHHEMRRPSPG